jgi:hypothetical protein
LVPDFSDADLSSLPKLAPTDLRLLWVNDWYDGPLEAVIEHGGERCLMVLNGGSTPDVERPMKWVLYRLSKAQWADEDRWHALFEEHVGHHWCFDHEAPPEPEEPRETKHFYEPYAKREPRTLERREAFAWVDEMPAR